MRRVWPPSGWCRPSPSRAVSWWPSTPRPDGCVSSPSTASRRLCRPPADNGWHACGREHRSGGVALNMSDGPLIVQSDKTVLLEVDHEQAGAARAAIAPFAELERAPEHVHTYRITPLALWNA